MDEINLNFIQIESADEPVGPISFYLCKQRLCFQLNVKNVLDHRVLIQMYHGPFPKSQ